MKVGDLVKKRFGHFESWQRESVGIVLSREWRDHHVFITVLYPNRDPELYRRLNFEVISESE